MFTVDTLLDPQEVSGEYRIAVAVHCLHSGAMGIDQVGEVAKDQAESMRRQVGGGRFVSRLTAVESGDFAQALTPFPRHP